MARLIAKTPAHGLLPVSHKGLTLSETKTAEITSIAAFKDQQKAVSAALQSAAGLGFPAPNRWLQGPAHRVVWSAQGQALLFGPCPDLPGAALTDQSDAWTCLTLQGAAAAETLARLTPLDLRDSQFRQGHAARSLLGHMNAVFLRSGPDCFEILIFRSMAQTAVHEVTRAMASIAAQTP